MTTDPAQLRGLAAGEIVVLVAASTGLGPGDECRLEGTEPLRSPLKAAYRRWASEPAPGCRQATVVSVHDAVDFDPEKFSARHLFAEHPEGRVLVLRVRDELGPVLSEEAFAARRRSVERARR